MSKKILSLIMSVVMMFTAFSAIAGAVYDINCEITDYPVIIVPGYSGSDGKAWSVGDDLIAIGDIDGENMVFAADNSDEDASDYF